MNCYPFHLVDYAAHTAHLEPLEDLAYRRMLDAYYLREEPLPADPKDVARLIRLRAHESDVELVLVEFFTLTDAGWMHARCDTELAKLKDRKRWLLDVTNARWAELRSQVFERDRHTCVYCGHTGPRLECDHIVPLSRGGTSAIENLATACISCNRSKGAKSVEGWINGY